MPAAGASRHDRLSRRRPEPFVPARPAESGPALPEEPATVRVSRSRPGADATAGPLISCKSEAPGTVRIGLQGPRYELPQERTHKTSRDTLAALAKRYLGSADRAMEPTRPTSTCFSPDVPAWNCVSPRGRPPDSAASPSAANRLAPGQLRRPRAGRGRQTVYLLQLGIILSGQSGFDEAGDQGLTLTFALGTPPPCCRGEQFGLQQSPVRRRRGSFLRRRLSISADDAGV